ncbi:MAG TPA: nucleotidyltransferase substrate binding protein [Thermodesulfobacteriota bacterium]|nr:nucleotidyltransferase substrate binding protein [Thermodesulfobacteriota bacterium]
MKRLAQIRGDFKSALRRLDEALKDAKTDLEVDGAIQRFEFTFELIWKLLRLFLEDQGIICRTPKACLKEAYRIGVIDDEVTWLNILDDRNMSVHIYDKETSRKIFKRVKTKYIKEFKKVFEKVGK